MLVPLGPLPSMAATYVACSVASFRLVTSGGMRVQIGDAGITSGASPVILVPQDVDSNVQTSPGLIAVPVETVQTPAHLPEQEPTLTPDFTGQRVEMIDLYIKEADEMFYGILCQEDDDIKVTWVPGEQDLSLCILPDATPPTAMRTPPMRTVRRVLPTNSSPAAFSPEALANRMRRVRRKLCQLEAELAFLRAQQDHTPPPSRITSDPYSPVSGRAQTVRTPPTGHGTHSSPVVIGDSPVVLD